MILEDWYFDWAKVYKKPNVKPNTYKAICSVFRIHLIEELKNTELNELKVFEIDKALSMLPPNRTKKHLYDNLVACLFKAFCLDYINRDISKLIQPVKFFSRQGQALSADEIELFLKKIKGHKLERLFRFYLYTGVRRHEALQLNWSDVDFDNNVILIRGTKTKSSYRYIPITSEVFNILNSYRNKSGRVFKFNDDYVTKTFKKICPEHRLHDLRHTFATLCAENNVHPSATQRMLGHSKIDTTMRIYTHVSTEFMLCEASKLDKRKKPFGKGLKSGGDE